MRKMIAIAVFALLSQTALATKVARVTIPEMYKQSGVIVYGEIEAGKVLANDCGVEYAVRVNTSFKGRVRPAALLWFQSNRPMQIGSQYFLFLSATANEFSPLISISSDAEKMHARYIAHCKSNRPALVVNVFGDGAIKETGTSNPEVPHAVLLGNILDPPPELKVTTLGPYDRFDNDTLDSATDFAKFTGYLNALSDHH